MPTTVVVVARSDRRGALEVDAIPRTVLARHALRAATGVVPTSLLLADAIPSRAPKEAVVQVGRMVVRHSLLVPLATVATRPALGGESHLLVEDHRRTVDDGRLAYRTMDPAASAATGPVGPRGSRAGHRHLDAIGALPKEVLVVADGSIVAATLAALVRPAQAIAAMALEMVDVGATVAVASRPLAGPAAVLATTVVVLASTDGDVAIPSVGDVTPNGLARVLVLPSTVRLVAVATSEVRHVASLETLVATDPEGRVVAIRLETTSVGLAVGRRPRAAPAVVTTVGPFVVGRQTYLAGASEVGDARAPHTTTRLVRLAPTPVQGAGAH